MSNNMKKSSDVRSVLVVNYVLRYSTTCDIHIKARKFGSLLIEPFTREEGSLLTQESRQNRREDQMENSSSFRNQHQLRIRSRYYDPYNGKTLLLSTGILTTKDASSSCRKATRSSGFTDQNVFESILSIVEDAGK